MLKTYRIYRERAKSITVQADDSAFVVNFQSVGNFKEFSTREKELQDALEKDIRFKSVYFLVGGTYAETEETEETGEVGETGKVVEVVETGETGKIGEKEKVIETYEGITTTQQAKAVLREKGISIANSAPMAKVLEVANENGIEFPNLV